jgi:oxygen-independent coproporphyrinogen-3 oxidase
MSARSQLEGSVYRNHERIGEYLRRIEAGRSPVETVFDLDARDRKTQFVAGSLGNGKSLDRGRWRRSFGEPIEADFGELLGRLRAADLIEDDGARIALTEWGRLVYDRVMLCFYPERARTWLASRPAPRTRGATSSALP